MYLNDHDSRATYDQELFLWSLYTTRVCLCVVLLFTLRPGRGCRLRRSLFSRVDHVWMMAEVLACANPTADSKQPFRAMLTTASAFAPVPVFLYCAENQRPSSAGACVLFSLLQRTTMLMLAVGRARDQDQDSSRHTLAELCALCVLCALACRSLCVGASVYVQSDDAVRNQSVKKKRRLIFTV